MRLRLKMMQYFSFWLVLSWTFLLADNNQTSTLSPIFSGQALPFQIRVEILKDKKGRPFLLPNGLQSYDVGTYKGKWLLINGRTNGVHTFNDDPNNFPPQAQNTIVYVIDPIKGRTASRSLKSCRAGFDQDQVDSLSVTSAQSYQVGHTLYVVGGYGFRNAINGYTTFDALTAIDIPGMMRWVTHSTQHRASHYVRQIFDPLFKITGGAMYQLSKTHPSLLLFGQDFEGAYFDGGNFSQVYSEQVRRFHLHDDGTDLSVKWESPHPLLPDPNFRRRDLNIVPIIERKADGKLTPSLVTLSGVFTPNNGIWTVPVHVTADGIPSMADPADPYTFKQGMNHYACPTIGLFSKRSSEMYILLFGGLSYGFFENGTFQTDSEIPFINQITTIKIDSGGKYTQYLMSEEYPVILSTQSNRGNRLLFGAGAQFIPAKGLKKLQYDNGVFKLDQLDKPYLLGYLVGGIQSTLPNTNVASDSAASPYIFKVTLHPTNRSDSN